MTARLSDVDVQTNGQGAQAILVQSVGGFGSSGANNSNSPSYGADGGSGGDGGAVNLTLGASGPNTVRARGDQSTAISVQSVGGGGGSGGFSDTLFALGGDGDAGGSGASVTLSVNKTSVETEGAGSVGILANSVGGGGGAGGGASGISSHGGSSGSGGDGGAVRATFDGSKVTTRKDGGLGFAAASIGGGGGVSHNPSGLFRAQGGNGGGGGAGGNVSYKSQGQGLEVKTAGDNADGISLLSVGGGGGSGSSTFNLSIFNSHRMGGTGGDGGAGGAIDLNGSTADMIATTGNNSVGLSAITVGGGGGRSGSSTTISLLGGSSGNSSAPGHDTKQGSDGGGDGNTGGDISGTFDGTILTKGKSSTGVLLVSAGQGGGSAGTYTSVNVGARFTDTLGASGGSGGDGGAIAFTLGADVATEGDQSGGVEAISVGGGGGQSSTVINATVGLDLSSTSTQGASGGDGGDGGDVALTSNGSIQTKGRLSSGILALSVARGGGKSGTSVDAGVDVLRLGKTLSTGAGGDGGASGHVTVVNNGSIQTDGGLSFGVLAASVAGGGGASGTAVNGTIALGNFSTSQGGSGGEGGSAGNVEISTSRGSSVSTTGDKSTGLLALSLGGGGGAGGSVFTGSLSITNLSDSVGGAGNDGGKAGDALINNSGAVSTSGVAAMGVAALSIGGNGGAGGVASNLSLTAAPPDVLNINITASVGGSGGDGGKSGIAKVFNDASIMTTGSHSAGIMAQTIGGSGGVGGNVYAGNLNIVTEGSLKVSVDIGGSGGDGGVADVVDVTNAGTIRTSGSRSSAIYAQSVGGHGGTGGNSFLASGNLGAPKDFSFEVTVGGSGGDGVQGGDVKAINSKSLVTEGVDSHGIFAQSIGGSGGDGGTSSGFVGNLGKATTNYFNMLVSTQVGGSGGSSQHAGAVTVENDGSIVTTEDTSYGIFAQSVGGGGGYGGAAGTHAGSYFKRSKGVAKENLSMSVTIGGGGGAAGDGNAVSVSNTNTISTSGTASYAIFAQSVGGGGGHGGNGKIASDGLLAELSEVGEFGWSIYKFVDEFKKIGGKKWRELLIGSWAIDVGGKGGASGDGGDITVTNTKTLVTSGDSATAIFAQSVGGGGGSGGDGTQGTLTQIGVAGSDSGGGDGGDVTVISRGDIRTSGDGAMGIQVQSLGGGGGNAGDVESSIVTHISGFVESLGSSVFGPAIGQHGGKGGDGGKVTVEMKGNLITTGDNAHGIWAHSVGGGGGAAPEAGGGTGLSHKHKIGGAGKAGDSGLVSISVPGSISVNGEGSHAIFAQSASGVFGWNGGVKVNVAGTVEANGKNGRAILVQSDQLSPHHTGTSSVTVEKGGLVRKTGPHDNYGAIGFLSGLTFYGDDGAITVSNSLTNHGLIFSPATVVESDGQGGLRLNNFGTMYGQLHFAGDAQTEVTVEKGGMFYLGSSDLGSASNSVFVNNGTVKPGWRNDTREFTIKSGGAFVQSNTGLLQFDADLSSDEIKNGQLVLETASARLDGQVSPHFIGNPDLKNGATGTFTDVVTYSGTGSFEKDGLTATPDAAIAYDLNWGNDNSLSIDFEVDYSGRKTGANLSQNAVSFGQFFSTSMEQLPEEHLRGEAHEALSDLGRSILNAGSGQALAAIYDEHILDEAAIGTQIALKSAQSIHNFLKSCPNVDPGSPKTFLRQHECFWGQAIGQTLDQDATESMPGFDGQMSGFAIGAQKNIGIGWFVEGGVQYTQSSINADNFSMDGSQISAGVTFKKEMGKFEFSGSIAGGTFKNDHNRRYSALTNQHEASSDIDGHFASVELGAAAIYETGGTYFKPSATLLVSHISQDDFTEAGSGALNWEVDSVDYTAMYARPQLELGRAFDWSNGFGIGFVRAGILHQLNDPGVDLRARLAGGGSGLQDLGLSVAPDRTQFEVSAGVNANIGEGFSLELVGTSIFSDSRDALSGQIRLQWEF